MRDFDFLPSVSQMPIVFCKECRFWDSTIARHATKTPEGLCRRHAPMPSASDTMTDSGTVWPRSFEDDWCGEGEARLP